LPWNAGEVASSPSIGYADGPHSFSATAPPQEEFSAAMAKKTAKKKAPAKKAPAKKAPAKKATAKKAPAKKKAAPAKKKADDTKKKPAKKRTRTVKEIRLKAYWGVFNQSLRRVALFEFNERKLADKKAQDLTKGGKSPHFVQPVKEAIEG
jgi:hypothetical protein